MSRNKEKTNAEAFTLIELLIVIAIIGILASVVLISLRSGKGKARDANRVSELKSIAPILHMYYLDHTGYPGNCNSYYWFHNNQLGLAIYFPQITSFYGPNGTGDQYAYAVSCDHQSYRIGARVESAQYRTIPFSNFPGNYNPAGVYQLN